MVWILWDRSAAQSTLLRAGKGPTVPDPCEAEELETTVTRAT